MQPTALAKKPAPALPVETEPLTATRDPQESGFLAGEFRAHARQLQRACVALAQQRGLLRDLPAGEVKRDVEALFRAWRKIYLPEQRGEVHAQAQWLAARSVSLGRTIEETLTLCSLLRETCRQHLLRRFRAAGEKLAEILPTFERVAEQFSGDLAVNLVAEREKRNREHTGLFERIITAQEDERKRVARDLHDNTGQSLTALLIGLRRLEQLPELGEGRSAVTEMRRRASQALEELHHLTADLRPSALDDLGLAVALQRYGEEYARRNGIAVEMQLQALEGVRLEPAAEIALYRIVQEALTNVAKHAHAHLVSVLMQCRKGSLLLIIEDDGRGFAMDQVNRSGKHFGLMGMQERVHLLGGKLTIESTPGAGTTIYIEMPSGYCASQCCAGEPSPRSAS